MNEAGSPGAPRSRACRSCGAEVWDLRHIRTGNTAPIEVRLSPGGNVTVDLEAGTYCLLSRGHLADARILVDLAERARKAGIPIDSSQDIPELHLNHFASCPSAERWHKR